MHAIHVAMYSNSYRAHTIVTPNYKTKVWVFSVFTSKFAYHLWELCAPISLQRDAEFCFKLLYNYLTPQIVTDHLINLFSPLSIDIGQPDLLKIAQ